MPFDPRRAEREAFAGHVATVGRANPPVAPVERLPTEEHGAPPAPDDPRAGFVLALVVLLLFAIGIGGAASYQIVVNESRLALHANEGQRALSIARAGLHRYVAMEIGIHDDTVAYAIESGDAVITARLVAEIDDFSTLYLLSSEGVYTDPTIPSFAGKPARRTIHQFAIKREVALDHMAAMTQVTGDLHVEDDAHIDGMDGATDGECVQTSVNIIGIMMGSGTVTLGTPDYPLAGTPDSLTLGTSAAALDSIGLDWDLLTDSDFGVDYQNTWPSCALPSDSFTVTRFTGNLTPPSSPCGQGVLIVQGTFTGVTGFQWDGVLLAGFIADTSDNWRIDGLTVGGLNGAGTASRLRDGTHIDYDRCTAFKAGKRLSHFQLVEGSWWEAM